MAQNNTSLWLSSFNSSAETVGSIWNSSNNLKVAKTKVQTLSGELELLKETNNGKEIELKNAQLELEQTKLEEATKIELYSFILKIVALLSVGVVAIFYIKNPFKKK